MKPITAAVLAGLIVGAPAGYVAAGVIHGAPPPPPPPPHVGAPPTMDHPPMDHGGMRAGPGREGGEDAASRAFREAAARMHSGMTMQPTGDVDLDFAQGMVPHHQGAIDMARIELDHGTDRDMRALARTVVDAQEAEIATMRKWIAARHRQRP